MYSKANKWGFNKIKGPQIGVLQLVQPVGSQLPFLILEFMNYSLFA